MTFKCRDCGVELKLGSVAFLCRSGPNGLEAVCMTGCAFPTLSPCFYCGLHNGVHSLECPHHRANLPTPPYRLPATPTKRCECGTDAVGGGIHARYCPKAGAQ